MSYSIKFFFYIRCTLKTSVTGEIDLDKLFEQLDKGLIGTDILLENHENLSEADTDIDMLADRQHIGGESGTTEETEVKNEGGDKTTQKETDQDNVGSKSEGDNLKETTQTEEVKEQTTTSKTTTTTSSSTTTTTPTTTTPTTTPATTTTEKPAAT